MVSFAFLSTSINVPSCFVLLYVTLMRPSDQRSATFGEVIGRDIWWDGTSNEARRKTTVLYSSDSIVKPRKS